ncbi:hypothetical protein AAHN97_19625 [Chitinophaga niabensis]|uniref:hypothetical protein n=1 Tax=Chitinophaga niabensis TaxID=536979 RepID=UPI0031BA22FF
MLGIICSLCALLLLAQPPRLPSIGVYSLKFTEVFAADRNPAALAGIKKYTAGIYAERRFMLKEMSGYALNGALPVAAGTMGIRIKQFGFSLYKEQMFGLGYALPLGKKLKAGIHLNYNMQRAPQFNEAGMIAECGVLWQIAEQVGIGVNVFNPAGKGLKLYTLGMGYAPSSQLLIEAECRKEEGKPLSTLVDGVYRPLQRFWLLGGFATQPVYQFAGLGFVLRNMRISVTGSRHQLLGFTPGITVIWEAE